jgi:hypothetical protein
VYLPGFFRHHSIRLRGSWQDDANSSYHFENRFDFFRNKRDQLFHQLELWSVDYKLPLAYPDVSLIKGLFYCQRLKADFFTEWGTGKPSFAFAPVNHYTNMGIELTADVNVLRFLLPCEVGLRTAYLMQSRLITNSFIFKLPLF